MKKTAVLLFVMLASLATSAHAASTPPPGASGDFIVNSSNKWGVIHPASPLVLPFANGGTGLSTLGSASQCLQVNGGGTALTYATCAPASTTINLGTSASAANPRRSGDATTGFFSDTANTVETSAGGVVVQTLNETTVSLGLGGNTDDCAAIQTLVTNAEANGPALMVAVPGATYNCPNSGITFDPSLVTWEGNGATFNFVSMTTGPLFTLTQTNAGSTNLAHYLEGFYLSGPTGGSTTIDAFLFYTTNTNFSSRYNVRNVVINGSRHCGVFQTGAYIITFSEVQCQNHQSSGWYSPPAFSNYGEQIAFRQVTTAQGPECFDNETGTGGNIFQLFGGSCDYEPIFIHNNAGVTEAFGAHFETNGSGASAPSSPPFYVGNNTGSRINLHGGIITFDQTPPFSGFSAIVDVEGTSTTGGQMLIDGTQINNTQLSSNTFCTGSGRLDMRQSWGDDIVSGNSILCALTNTWGNLLYDGSFAQTTITDFWRVTKDTEAITQPFAGTNIVLSMDTGATNCAAASGSTYALSAHKIGAAATAAAFSIFVPIPYHQMILNSLYYSTPSTSTGSFTVQNYFYQWQGNDANGVPYPLDSGPRSAINSAITVTMSGSAIPYTEYSKSQNTKTQFPAWANYEQIEFDLTAAPAGYYCVGSAYLSTL